MSVSTILSELDRLHHLVRQYLKTNANSDRHATLEKQIRAEITQLAHVKNIDVETLSEKHIRRTERNIINALNPLLREEQREAPRLQLRPKPSRSKEVLAIEIQKLRTQNMLTMAEKINAVLLQLDVDPENTDMLRNLPQATKDMAAKMYFVLRRMDPEKSLPRLEVQEDLYAAGARISRLILDNADNYMAVPKLGPGLGGPLGRGPAGKILEIIPDIIQQLQMQDNLEHKMAQEYHSPTPLPTTPTPLPADASGSNG